MSMDSMYAIRRQRVAPPVSGCRTTLSNPGWDRRAASAFAKSSGGWPWSTDGSQAVAVREGDRFKAVVNVEFPENVLDVVLYSSAADEEATRD